MRNLLSRLKKHIIAHMNYKLVVRMRLLWHALRRPVYDQDQLVNDIGKIGHHVTQLPPQHIEKNPWTKQLRALLYQAVFQNILDDVVSWGFRIWSEAIRLNHAKHETPVVEDKEIIDGLPNALENIRKRQSVRSFERKPIPKGKIQIILESAIDAPCSCNRQPWRFLVLDQIDHIKLIAQVRNAKWIAKAGAVLLVFCDLSYYQTSGREREYTPYLDAGAAIQNVLLSATAIGISTCWVNCGPQEIPETTRKEIYQRFSIDENMLWAGIVVMGYGAKRFPKPPRQAVEKYLLSPKLFH